MPRRPRASHHTRQAVLSQKPNTGSGPLDSSSRVTARRRVTNIHQDGNNDSGGEFSNEGIAAGVHVDRDDQYEDVDDEEDEDEDGDEDDADVPRVSQWLDEDQIEGLEEESSGSDEGEEPEDGPSQLKRLRNNLSGLPFGALRKAQNALNYAEVMNDSEDDGDSSEDADLGSDDVGPVQAGGEGKVEWSTKARNDIAKRSNKHAPTEVTSKRPVTRLRQVVEVKKIEARDPRFLFAAGEFRADKYQDNYGFLAEIHGNELKTLRENLKRARKMLDNAPRDLRDEYEAEVERLELAVKRAESIVNRERADKVQREALQKVSKGENEKRKQGKGSWYLKKSEQRELVARARYEALAAEGGQRAVKKAIEKKQKKIGQKEKKSRPFPRSPAVDDPGARKRRRVG